MDDSPFKPSFFEREDESDDALFYALPRMVAHIDEYAIEAARRLYRELVPQGARLLDVMSSRYSHLPEELAPASVVGLGMNLEELQANPQLTAHVVHDLNREPRLPFDDGAFDAAVITVSVQYLTRPVEVFRDLARVLVRDAPLVVTYSNRMFPAKAVRIWRALDDRDRATLVASYFRYSGGWRDVVMADVSIESGGYHDPLYAVWAYRA